MVQRAPDARLIAIVGPASGEVFPLSNEQITLGRDPTNAICIPDQGLSRRHCALTPGAEGWEVRDLGSSNGTFIKVNGERNVGHESFVLLGQQLFRLNFS